MIKRTEHLLKKVTLQCWVVLTQIQLQIQLSLFNCIFLIAFLTQHLGLSIFDPNLG